jgi:hypothetical protein
MLSAKGAAFTASLGQRPRNHSFNKGISAESAIHARRGSSISAPRLKRAFSACLRRGLKPWGDALG